MSLEAQHQAVLARVVRTPGCWAWRGNWRLSEGERRPVYRRRYAYIWMWEILIGPWPKGMVFHHTCEDPECVNPYHGEPITQGQHLVLHGLAGDHHQAQKTHCPAGHAYDAANTYIHTRSDGRVERHCRACTQEAKRKYRKKLADVSHYPLGSTP